MKSDSILQSVKKIIGYPEEYTDFDKDLIMFINTEFGVLYQHGVGTDSPFMITGDSETWGDFIGDDDRLIFVETIVSLKAKILFDPPQSSFVLENLKETVKELEWRAYITEETVE